jgi:3-mercaptopyruvate sulfurtransferase SseA
MSGQALELSVFKESTNMALRRAAFAFNRHCIILNPRITYWKFKPSSLFYETLSAPGGTSSTKPCYNEDRVVTFPCLKKLLSEKDIQLFDVRTRGEVDAGKIPGATNIPRKFSLNSILYGIIRLGHTRPRVYRSRIGAPCLPISTYIKAYKCA